MKTWFDPLRWLWTLVILIAVTLCVVYVWPTRYKYDHYRVNGFSTTSRIDRFTGDAYYLEDSAGWVKMEK
jgi:hypothetical protein